MHRVRPVLWLISALVVGVPTTANAGWVWSEPLVIVEIRHFQDTRIRLTPDIVPTAAGCTRFRLFPGESGLTRADVKEMLAMLLTAMAIQGEVRLRFDDALPSPGGPPQCSVRELRVLAPG